MPHSQTKLFIRKKNAGSATKRPADWYLVGQGKNSPVSAKSLTSQQRGNIGTRAMQKTKIAAEELAEMIRDGLAEEGHDVQVRPNPETGWDVAVISANEAQDAGIRAEVIAAALRRRYDLEK